MSRAGGRPERNLPEGGGALVDFARDLAALRKAAGLTVRQLADRSHYSVTTISRATDGKTVPSRELTASYVRACGSEREVEDWLRRRDALESAAPVVGPYEAIRLLGSGGTSEVWEATDTRTGRRVALKMLVPNALADPETKQRFRQECQLAASVQHPHVLPVFDYEVAGTRPYIVMPLIDGSSLAAVIRQGPLAPERAVAIVEQVAAALDVAHRTGLRHRDVKPSNIMLQNGALQGADHALLFDWGMAQPIDPSGPSSMTRHGQVVGTPAYIAPERLQGPNADHRADVYALAVVLYECLTGRKPFDGTDAQVLAAHLRDEPPQLPDLPDDLNAVLAKGLAKSPGDRYQSATELAEAARAVLHASVRATAGDSIPTAHPTAGGQPGQVPATRSRLATGVGWPVGGVVGALLVTLSLLWLGFIDWRTSAWTAPTLATGAGLLGWALSQKRRSHHRSRPTRPEIRNRDAQPVAVGDRNKAVMARSRLPMPRRVLMLAATVTGVSLTAAVVVMVVDRSLPPESAQCSAEPIKVRGVIGSEKQSFFEDVRVISRFACLGLSVAVDSLGSREMVAALERPDHGGYDFVFPANTSTAERIMNQLGIDESFPTFSSPMAIATFTPIVDVLAQAGIVQTAQDGSQVVDVSALIEAARNGLRWDQLPGNTIYPVRKRVLLSTADPQDSNSGLMFLAIASHVANGGAVVTTTEQVRAVMPDLCRLMSAQGAKPNSTQEVFENYLTGGVGRVPLGLIYEEQYKNSVREHGPRLPDQSTLLYPKPTIYSRHTVVPINDYGKQVGKMLKNDPELKRLADEHGYRIEGSTDSEEPQPLDVIEPPTDDILQAMVDALNPTSPNWQCTN